VFITCQRDHLAERQRERERFVPRTRRSNGRMCTSEEKPEPTYARIIRVCARFRDLANDLRMSARRTFLGTADAFRGFCVALRLGHG